MQQFVFVIEEMWESTGNSWPHPHLHKGGEKDSTKKMKRLCVCETFEEYTEAD